MLFKYDIAIVSGGFDPLHVGHINMIEAAKNLAYHVVVGINSNDWLVKKKGYFLENSNKIDYNTTCMKVGIVSTNYDSAIF